MKKLVLAIALICISCGGGDVVARSNPNKGSVSIVTTKLPPAARGVSYSYQLSASGGNGVYVWTGQGLPGGLTLTGSGLISGIPTQSGKFQVHVTVTSK